MRKLKIHSRMIFFSYVAQNSRALQTPLTSVEGELQFARQYYNDSVVQLNTALTTVPSMWFAGMAGVRQRDMYSEPDGGRRSAPPVSFS